GAAGGGWVAPRRLHSGGPALGTAGGAARLGGGTRVTRRRALAYALTGAALAALVAGAVALVRAPLPTLPRGPEPGRSLFQTHCATCHGPAGRGASRTRPWRRSPTSTSRT